MPCASRDLTSSRRWRCCRRDSASLRSAGDASNIAKSRLQERRASCEEHSETEWRGDDEACKDLREEALLGAASTAVVSSRGAPTTSGTEPRRDPASPPLAKASQAARKRMYSELLSSFRGEPSGASQAARKRMSSELLSSFSCEPSGEAGIVPADMGAEGQSKPRIRCRRTCRTELQIHSKIRWGRIVVEQVRGGSYKCMHTYNDTNHFNTYIHTEIGRAHV